MGNCTATGYAAKHLPKGGRTDELIRTLRLGVKFRAQHKGKRRGTLARLVLDCTRRAGLPYSFAQLLDELSLDAARRELYGEQASPVEKVDRVWGLVTVHVSRGRVQIPFRTLQNHLTAAKKRMRAEIPLSPKP